MFPEMPSVVNRAKSEIIFFKAALVSFGCGLRLTMIRGARILIFSNWCHCTMDLE